MKKLSLLLILVLLVSCIVLPTAYASETEYIKVKGSDTIFYNDDINQLFVVTEGCYVKFLSDNGDGYTNVNYFGLTGKIETTSLDFNTKTTGDDSLFGQSKTVLTSAKTSLFDLPGSTKFAVNLEPQKDVTPLGNITVGSDNYTYVKVTLSSGTYYGAIFRENIPAYEIVPPSVSVAPPTQNPDNPNGGGSTSLNPDDTKAPENNLVRILLIIGICVPVLIIVFLIFKPVKPSSNRYASETRRRDDYEDFE